MSRKRYPSSRRQQKASDARPKGRALLQVAIVAVIGGGCAYGATVAVKALTQGEALPVRTIAVKGAPDGRANEIRTYANIHVGAPLLGVDLDAVSRRVREHPFVAAAAARRVPPDTIEIEVLARRPAALLAAGSTYLVDDAGHPFKRARPGDALDLPVISGDVFEASSLVPVPKATPAVDGEATEKAKADPASVPAIGADVAPTSTPSVKPAEKKVDIEAVQRALLGLDAVTRSPDAASALGRLDEVLVEKGFGLTLVFSSGVRARVGSGLLDSKLARLVRVVRKLRKAGHDPAEVYLADGRRPERVAVRLRPAPEVASDTGI